MKKTNDYLNVLKAFSDVLNNQVYDGNTEMLPTYWMIQSQERELIELYDADDHLVGFADEPKMSLDEFKKIAIERLNTEFESDPEIADELCERVKDMDIDDVRPFFEELIVEYGLADTEWDVEIYPFQYVWRDVPNQMFLTKRDAKAYIEQYGYRHIDPFTGGEKPLRTYAYIAENSPDLSALIHALRSINWCDVRTYGEEDKSEYFTVQPFMKVYRSGGFDPIYMLIKTPGVTPATARDHARKKLLDEVMISPRIYTIEERTLANVIENSSYHLIFNEGSENEFEVFIDRWFKGRTDDAIYEWVTERFNTTSYRTVKD